MVYPLKPQRTPFYVASFSPNPLNDIQIQGKLTLRWNTGQSESKSQPQYYFPPSKLLKSSYKYGLRTFPAREIHPRIHSVRQCDPHKAYSHKLSLWCHRAPPLHISPSLAETQFKYTSVWILHSCSNPGRNTLLILNQIVSYWMPLEIQFFSFLLILSLNWWGGIFDCLFELI